MTRLHVGNLPPDLTIAQLSEAFAPHGDVGEVTIVADRLSVQPRGFGFVKMPDARAAHAAIEALHGAELGGRVISVNLAKPKAAGRRGGSGNGSRSHGRARYLRDPGDR